MGQNKLTADQSEAQLLISDDDAGRYHYDVAGGDVAVGTHPKLPETTVLRKGDSGPIGTPTGVPLYGELEGDGPATIELVPDLKLGREPRREMERPKDAAVRAGLSEIVNKTGAGLGAGSSSTELVIAENASEGVYRLQTLNLSERSGAWDPNIRVEFWIEESDGTIADNDKMEGNITQLPWNFPSPVTVPATFTAKAVVHNDSANPIDYRLNVAYTQEVMN